MPSTQNLVERADVELLASCVRLMTTAGVLAVERSAGHVVPGQVVA